jgi:hypothetical protein
MKLFSHSLPTILRIAALKPKLRFLTVTITKKENRNKNFVSFEVKTNYSHYSSKN